MMRLVFFNHSHPETKHVSGVRLWGFAKALAGRGHRVIHVTATLEGQRGTCMPFELEPRLRTHDWREPFHLAVEPASEPVLDMIRRDAVLPAIRKALTAYSLLFRGGVFFDWTKRLLPYMHSIAAGFQPDLACGTFGNTSNLAAARRMARMADCAFVVDVKDSVSAFIPKGARNLVARGFRRPSGATVNARVLAPSAMFLTGRPGDVIYSGVDAAFYELAASGAEDPKDDRFFITLTGSLRSVSRLREFLRGCARFRERRGNGFSVRLVYAGNERGEVEAAISELGIEGWIACEGYLSTRTLAALVRAADVNAYISAAQAGFHHKFLELVSTGKPVIAYGGELPESLELVRGLDTPVFDPRDGAALDDAFESIVAAKQAARQCGRVSKFGWEERVRELEPVLRRAIEEGA